MFIIANASTVRTGVLLAGGINCVGSGRMRNSRKTLPAGLSSRWTASMRFKCRRGSKSRPAPPESERASRLPLDELNAQATGGYLRPRDWQHIAFSQFGVETFCTARLHSGFRGW